MVVLRKRFYLATSGVGGSWRHISHSVAVAALNPTQQDNYLTNNKATRKYFEIPDGVTVTTIGVTNAPQIIT
jgi:hypothetical protein